MKAIPTCKKITHNDAANYLRAVIKKVNVFKESHDNKRKKRITGLTKVSSIIHNRSNHSDPRICIHKILGADDHMWWQGVAEYIL